MTKRPQSFQIVHTYENGIPRTVAKVLCAKCQNVLDVPILKGDFPLVLVEKKARHAGWLFNRTTARKCICASCYLGAADEDQAPALVDAPAMETTMEAAFIAAVRETKEMRSVSPSGEPLPAGSKGPTPVQKLTMRRFLDGHYDEELKGYLEGHTDKTAGDACGVPWSWIRDLREVAYGPLERDGELVEIREKYEILVKEYQATGGVLRKLEERIRRLESKWRVQ